jgi:hypothetical protein
VDKTDLMVEVMYRELDQFHDIKESFVKEFSQEDFDWIVKVIIYNVKLLILSSYRCCNNLPTIRSTKTDSS